jgi:hypothetical protein
MAISISFTLQLDNLFYFEILWFSTIFNFKIYIMQRLITVGIDTTQLMKNPNEPFSISEVESINEMLGMGWEIEEWDFLKEDSGDGQILLLVTLNDDMVFSDEDDFEDGFEFEDEDEEYDDDDDDEEGLEEERKL